MQLPLDIKLIVFSYVDTYALLTKIAQISKNTRQRIAKNSKFYPGRWLTLKGIPT